MIASDIKGLVRKEVREVRPCFHGGAVEEKIKTLLPERVIDFSSNVNPIGPSLSAIKAILNNLDKINQYPDRDGLELRDEVSRTFNLPSRNNVILGNGSSELIHLFAEAFIEKRDRALIPIPTFGEYEVAVKKMGGEVIYVRPKSNFTLDTHSILKTLEERRFKCVFLCNPNNPTGLLIPKEDVDSVLEACVEADCLLFMDEAFMDFVEGGFTYMREACSIPNLFVIRSMTKFYGLAGLRVGYGVGYKELVGFVERVKPPWNLNLLAQVASIEALRDGEFAHSIRRLVGKERSFLLEGLRKIRGLEPLPSVANFILVDIRGSGLNSRELTRALLKKGVLVRDCSSFQDLGEEYIRVAVRSREDNLKLLDSLREVLGERGHV